jgi:hypothetical protein
MMPRNPTFILKKSNSPSKGLNLKMKELSSIFWKRLNMMANPFIQTGIFLRKKMKLRAALVAKCLNMSEIYS